MFSKPESDPIASLGSRRWGVYSVTALIAAAMITGIAIDGHQLVKSWGAKPPVSVQELRFREFLAFDKRNLDLPVVILSSVFRPQSIEYHFSPSPTQQLFFLPATLDETALAASGVTDKRIARYRRLRRVAKERDQIYSGDPAELLHGKPKYILVYELDGEAVSGIEECDELELVHSSSDGQDRWYKAN